VPKGQLAAECRRAKEALAAPARARRGSRRLSRARYEAKGDRAKARKYYGKLLELWQTADPELQGIVRDTKERVGRLSGEH
jgi:hypothetical protein